jgi:fructose 5-dehydrogenase cytochrome subunit
MRSSTKRSGVDMPTTDMRTMLSDLLYGVLITVAGCWTVVAHADEAAGSADLIKRGEYLAKAADCGACHTTPQGKPFAGGLAITSPVGTIYSTNITPSVDHGIGRYTEEEFERAVRRGIRADGTNLYPAMPYTSYSILTDEDVHALYSYFKQGVVPVEAEGPRTDLPFPMNIRLSMKGWNLLFLNSHPFRPDPAQSEAWNRGKYLVEGAAHCSACHTPRGFLMQERGGRAFAGGQVGTWYAPNITSDVNSGIGGWSQSELVDYLRTGDARGKAQAAGDMGEAVEHSFQYLSEADVNAMATYVRTVPAIHDPADPNSRFSFGKASSDLGVLRGKNGIRNDDGDPTGAELFQANCASCHSAFGQGSKDGYYPSLFSNSALGSNNPNNLIAAILNGVNRTTSIGQAYMPGFAGGPNDLAALTDREIVLLANYLLERYGRPGVVITTEQVAEVRRGGPSSSLVTLARVGISAAAVVVVFIFIFVLVRTRTRSKSDE